MSAASVKKTKATKTSKPRKTKKGASLGFGEMTPYKEKAGEEYMSSKQVEHFNNFLVVTKQKLMEEVDRTKEHMQTEATNFADLADRATQETDFSIELRERDRERKLIKKIEEALERIESDEYGFCEACGIEIGIRRLEARPTATLCIDCKTLDEIQERQQGGV